MMMVAVGAADFRLYSHSIAIEIFYITIQISTNLALPYSARIPFTHSNA